jgi:flavin prenyltransferase
LKNKFVVAITGASGAIYARNLLQQLEKLSHQLDEVGVVMSENAKDVWKYELDDESYKDFNFRFYDKNDFMAPFASGSAKFNCMIICPCSMGTLARIAQGISNDLITRAADVILKERRKLILVTRETPLNLIHLRNMQSLAEAGAIICPATPSFYSKPTNLDEVALTVVNRAIELSGLESGAYQWGEIKKH